jgi:hypothetical protein
MRAHEHGPDHDHDHDESHRSAADADTAALPHMLRAAVAGRTDVIGTAGLGMLQRLVGNSGVGAVLQREQEEQAPAGSSVHDVVAGGGESLDTGTRSDMEARLGADFTDVRVHTGTEAHASATEVGARAYTVGNHIVFQRDAYDTASDAGRTTLAHELAHVVQQRQGPVDGTETPGGIRVSDPSDRFEQEAAATAERVMTSPSPSPQTTASSPGPTAPAPAPVQRTTDDTAAAETPDTSSVQRETEEDKDDEEPPAS